MKGHTDKYKQKEYSFDLNDRMVDVYIFTNGGDFYTVQTETTFYDENDQPINLVPKYTRRSFRGITSNERAEEYFNIVRKHYTNFAKRSIYERAKIESETDNYVYSIWPHMTNQKELEVKKFMLDKYPKTIAIELYSVADLLIEWDKVRQLDSDSK